MFISLAALGRQASASSITEIKGSTQGCFGSCGVFKDSTTDPTYGLTFDGVSLFDVTTDATGAATNIGLGTFKRESVNDRDSLPPLDFSLAVTFSLPIGVAGDTFQAIIQGKNSGGGGPLDIDFDNEWRHFTYLNESGTGSFWFAVLDDLQVNKNGGVEIIGSVKDSTFVSNSDVVTNAAVPEPTTMILLGTGVAAVLRRRRTSSTAR